MPIKDVGFNPEVILRIFHKIGVTFTENLILRNCSKIAFNEKSKSFCFSDLMYHAGYLVYHAGHK